MQVTLLELLLRYSDMFLLDLLPIDEFLVQLIASTRATTATTTARATCTATSMALLPLVECLLLKVIPQ
jgi:hypothetical protein